MNKIIVLALLTASSWAQAQDGRYVVFFKDKSGTTTPYSIDNPTSFLSQKSIDRRKRQGIPITEEDLPVNPTYLAELAQQVPIHYTLKWVNGALVAARSSELEAIKALSSVARMEYVAPLSGAFPSEPDMTDIPRSGSDELLNAQQLAMLGLDKMHDDNIFGQGVMVAVFDGGFQKVNTISPFRALFEDNRVPDTYDFVGLSSNVFRHHEHGTVILSVMAADWPDVYLGGVPQATYYLYVTEDVRHEYRVEEYNWMAAAERADSIGVDIINSSLGYAKRFSHDSMNYVFSQLDGNTAVISRAAKKALSRGIVVVNAAGNGGTSDFKSITPPADVAGVIAVGAVKDTYELSAFSSIGPTVDGRIKPDVAAQGEDVLSIGPEGIVGTQQGTSLASPLVASLAAGLLQVNPEATPAELYQLITSSATLSVSPNNQVGYGVPNYFTAINPTVTALEPLTENHRNARPFTVYANPVSARYLDIQLNDSNYKKEVYTLVLSIYSLQGQQVMTSTRQIDPSTRSVKYDIDTLPSGVYVAKIRNASQQQLFRLLKL